MDGCAVDAEGGQDEGGAEAGAVFAGGAVEQEGRGVLGQQQVEHFGVAMAPGQRVGGVGRRHQVHDRAACGFALFGEFTERGAERGVDRQVVDHHVGHHGWGGGLFAGAAEVGDAADAGGAQLGGVGWGEVRQPGGAEDPAEADMGAVLGAVAAEIADVGGAFEFDAAGEVQGVAQVSSPWSNSKR